MEGRWQQMYNNAGSVGTRRVGVYWFYCQFPGAFYFHKSGGGSGLRSGYRKTSKPHFSTGSGWPSTPIHHPQASRAPPPFRFHPPNSVLGYGLGRLGDPFTRVFRPRPPNLCPANPHPRKGRQTPQPQALTCHPRTLARRNFHPLSGFNLV